MGKVFSRSELALALDKIRKNCKIVFTNGCFDLLHVGHIRYLQEAKSLGSYLVVGINSDESIQRLKGPSRPIQLESDRAEILAALASVDAVSIFAEDRPEALIQVVRPQVLVKGGDWKIDQIAGGPFVKSYGGEVKSLKFYQGHSTTSLIEKSKN